MKGKGRWFLAAILVLALASTGLAFKNEPEGFRGLKWGDPPLKSMSRITTVQGTRLYKIPDENLDFGGAEARSIEYLFCDFTEQFYEVNVVFPREDWDFLKLAFRGRWGKETLSLFNEEDLYWSFGTVKMDLRRGSYVFLYIVNTAIRDESKELWEKEAAEKLELREKEAAEKLEGF